MDGFGSFHTPLLALSLGKLASQHTSLIESEDSSASHGSPSGAFFFPAKKARKDQAQWRVL
jgi:hypothetical protein